MTRNSARYWAKEGYKTFIYTGRELSSPCPGLLVYYHEDAMFVWWQNGFDGVQIVPVAMSWVS